MEFSSLAMIRGYQRGDLTRLHQLDQICFPPEIAYSRAELQHFLTQPNCSCWIVDAAGHQVAGFILVERIRSAGHIVTLDIDPEQRRRGLGRLLMQTAETYLKREGASVMSLEVAEDNSAARQFYRSLGFLTRGKIAKYYGGKIDAEVMQKTLLAMETGDAIGHRS